MSTANGNIGAKDMNYIKSSEDELMLLGIRYNLLRGEFRKLPKRKIRNTVKDIMITTGSTDPYNLSITFIL